MLRRLICLIVLTAIPAVALAQTTPVTAASTVTFTPSSDHTAVDGSGAAVVTRYDMETMAQNALGAIVFTQQLGKPAPVNNSITTNIAATVAALTGGVVYQARVAAVGPGGVGRSLLSNPFGLPTPPKVPAAPTGTPVIK